MQVAILILVFINSATLIALTWHVFLKEKTNDKLAKALGLFELTKIAKDDVYFWSPRKS